MKPKSTAFNPSTVSVYKTDRENVLEHNAARHMGEARNRFIDSMVSTGTVTRAAALERWLNLVRRECGIVEGDIAQRVFPSLAEFRAPRPD